jgi:xylan 1,4-beta-xylosidase
MTAKAGSTARNWPEVLALTDGGRSSVVNPLECSAMILTRRWFTLAPLLFLAGSFASAQAPSASRPADWARGIEGQRKADLGNGTFLNPIMPGDHADPSILRDGDDYYLTSSSMDAYPGLLIWHSRDLVNWEPVGPALFTNVGSVWAPDLVKHKGRYYIYFPGIGSPYRSNYVVWADSIRGPWSDPIDLKVGGIDPGHLVAADGRRYLFFSAGQVASLNDDGLSLAASPRKVYDGWAYPEDWAVETFALESPKMLRHGEYYYMVVAEGGTAGPPTSHMAVVSRSRSIDGPWENAPHNPLIRTLSRDERWWSKGHATIVEGPGGQWYAVYHAYENGYWTLGRQTILEPVEWTADGWLRRTGADVATPIRKPAGAAVPHGMALSDDFSTNKMGIQWSFYKGTVTDKDRYRYEHGALVLKARGTSPSDSSPLGCIVPDRAYEVEVEIDRDPGTSAGLLVFYNARMYAGLGVSDSNLIMYRTALERLSLLPPGIGRHVFLRLTNDQHVITIRYSADGKTWTIFGTRYEVSGYHHNVAYDFLSLRPALYASGSGEVRFRNFKYRALGTRP